MYNPHKNTKNIILFFLLCSSIIIVFANAHVATNKNNFLLTKTIDTIPTKNINADSNRIKLITQKTPNRDTTPLINNVTVIDTFNIVFSKDSLDAPIEREAIDSAIFLVKEKKFLLYTNAKTLYSGNTIDADFIEMDSKKETVRAIGLFDSTGTIIDEQLSLKTSDQNITADSILYNIKTGKALTHNTRTKNEEMFIQSKTVKLLGDKKSFFGYENKFTTCNLDEPHFCFHAKKIKVVTGNIAVSGFANPEFEGVPLPIGIPFGIFPLKKGKKGGVLPPQFTANEDLGLGLEGLGYYFTFKKNGKQSDYWDLTLRSNIYSYGSWNAVITPSYRKRYKYSGSFNLNIQNTKFNFKGDADYRKNKSFNFGWNHSADTRARPGVSFSANVNAGKSSFNQFNPNNTFRNTQNQLNSSITWSKTWQQKILAQDVPFNLTTSANHSQNTLNNSINLNLPEIGFSMQTFFPFQKMISVGTAKWYEKIGIGYNGNMRSLGSFYDNEPIKEILRTLKDTFQWGATHSIPISLSLPSLGPIQVSPSISYEERTYGQKMERNWNTTKKKVDTTLRKGVYQARQMAFGIGASSALYGTVNFKTKGSGLMAVRHVIRPSISANYTPNMNKKNNQLLQLDSTGYKQIVSKFDGNLYSTFGSQRFGGLSFGVENNIELKVRKKGDTTSEGERKIRLIDGFSINGGYNFLADSFKLSTISVSMRSTLADGKLNVTASASLDPYQKNIFGRNINKYAWVGNKFGLASLGTLSNANIALSTQFKGGDKSKDKDKDKKGKNNNQFVGNKETNDMSMDEQMQMNEYINRNPSEFVDFNIPWNLSLSAAINYSRTLQPDYSYKSEYNANVNFNGDFSLTEKWKCGASGFYDFRVGKVEQVTMFITREMHCWQLAINLVPIGAFRSFNISLSPKAGILRDLKINRSRFFYGE